MGIIETATQQGLLLALVSIGIAVSFRLLNFPDLTTDGSFSLGGSVVAVLLIQGFSPWTAVSAAFLAGMGAGATTGLLHAKLGISRILAGILTLSMLYSVNLRVMGRPNVSLLDRPVIFSWAESIGSSAGLGVVVITFLLVTVVSIVLNLWLHTNIGLRLRAMGSNPQAISSAGFDPGWLLLLGLSVSNGLVSACGALAAQSFGFADIGSGSGMIVVGFASLLIGEAILNPRRTESLIFASVIGSLFYQLLITAALRFGLPATDLKLTTSLVVVALLLWARVNPYKLARRDFA